MHIIVLVAKYPTPGTSKTRLSPLFGADGAASLAKAMLLDTLLLLTAASASLAGESRLFLLYAPATSAGRLGMEVLLHELCGRAASRWSATARNRSSGLRRAA